MLWLKYRSSMVSQPLAHQQVYVKNVGALRACHFEWDHIDILWSMLVLSGVLPTHCPFQWVGSAGCQSREENVEMGEFKESQPF